MTPAAARAMYRRQIDQAGEGIVLRRVVPTVYSTHSDGSTFSDGSRYQQPGPLNASVRARLLPPRPDQLPGSAQQMFRPMIVLAEDIESSGFPLPFQINKDRVVWKGKTLVLKVVDDETRRVAGVLIAYELTAAGA